MSSKPEARITLAARSRAAAGQFGVAACGVCVLLRFMGTHEAGPLVMNAASRRPTPTGNSSENHH
jgi:hypothetical protein